MKVSNIFIKLTIVSALVAICLYACVSKENTNGGTMMPEEIPETTVPEPSVKLTDRNEDMDAHEILQKDLNIEKKNLSPVEPPYDIPGDWYEGNDKTKYVFNSSTGRYEGFDKNISLDEIDKSGTAINSPDNFKTLANEAAAGFVDLSQYTYSYHYYEGTGVHRHYYHRYISGYKTTDLGVVSIYPNGFVGDVQFYNMNIFSAITVPTIDGTKMDKRFETALFQKFGDVITDYEIKERKLDLKDGELIIECFFGYTHKEGYSVGEVLHIPVQ